MKFNTNMPSWMHITVSKGNLFKINSFDKKQKLRHVAFLHLSILLNDSNNDNGCGSCLVLVILYGLWPLAGGFCFCLSCCMSCHSATLIIITRFGTDIGDFVLFVISFHKYNLRRCFPYSFFWCYLLTLINTFGFSGHSLGKLIRIYVEY